MTALEKFLKQIVLKQVEGSVYLVPAICDFQIDEALEEERKQGQKLPIDSVRLSCFKEVFEKFQEIEHESEFYGWLHAKAHEA